MSYTCFAAPNEWAVSAITAVANAANIRPPLVAVSAPDPRSVFVIEVVGADTFLRCQRQGVYSISWLVDLSFTAATAQISPSVSMEVNRSNRVQGGGELDYGQFKAVLPINNAGTGTDYIIGGSVTVPLMVSDTVCLRVTRTGGSDFNIATSSTLAIQAIA